MLIYTFEAILNTIQIVILLIILAGCVKLFGGENFSIAAVFFLFGIFSLMIVDLYWIAYDLLKPEVRMPFAANEFGEAAMLLLFGASIKTVFEGKLIREIHVLAVSVFFIASSTGLWIAWSGEWLEDIITGLSFGYFFCVTVMAMRTADVFGRMEWIAAGSCAMLLILFQTSIFFVPEILKKPIDTGCYIFMFAILSILLGRCIQSMKAGETGEKVLALSYGCYAWAVSTMYMSSGGWYVAALCAETAGVVLMFAGIRKEVRAE